jgi:hypothetical protein
MQFIREIATVKRSTGCPFPPNPSFSRLGFIRNRTKRSPDPLHDGAIATQARQRADVGVGVLLAPPGRLRHLL